MAGLVVGLCGPIGAGKTLALEVARSLGWDTVEVDRLAHGLYAPGTELSQAIFAAFGGQMRRDDGAVDRKALGRVVFADLQELARLEALVHPFVHRAMDEVVEATRRDGKRLLLEAAILPKRPEFCARLDAVIAVTAPAEMRLSRVMGRDGLSRQAALERMARAISPEKIRDCATHELVNGADPYDFRMRARELLQRLDTRT